MTKKVFTFEEFRSSKLSREFHYLVLGHPIKHSLSPIMHNLALQYHSIDAEYIAVDLAPHSIQEFTAWVHRDEFLGCNITRPYKQQFLSIPDLLSNEAEAIGAMNTISKNRTGTRLTGHNTDIIGFQIPLGTYKHMLDYGRAIIFGTGGASLAVQYALSDLGFEEIILVSRSPDQADYLKGFCNVSKVDYNQWQSFASDCSLIINTTPLGMADVKDKSVVQKHEAHLLADKVCYDLVYNPSTTQFLEMADQAGAVTINGLDMLIYQGSQSFKIWTGHTFPIEIVRDKLLTFFE